MRTTLDLDDALLTRTKIVAAQQRSSVTRLIEEGLRLRLKAPMRARAVCVLPVYHGKGGLAAGLTGLSNKALLDAADE